MDTVVRKLPLSAIDTAIIHLCVLFCIPLENGQTVPVDVTPSLEIPNRLHSHSSNLRVAGRELPLQAYA